MDVSNDCGKGADVQTQITTAPGILIAIEGIDGAGKTTQAQMLAESLRHAGFPVLATKEPTNGPHGQRIRRSAIEGRMSAEDELQAFLDDRREHVELELAPALARGEIVIVDRYYYSTAAYQGSRGLNPTEIIATNEAFAPRPDLLVLVDVPVDESLARVTTRDGAGNKFEERDSLLACAAVFDTISGAHVVRVDGAQPRSRVHSAILQALVRGPLFTRHCRKVYLEECEPEFCSFRMQDECDYPGVFTSLRTT